MLKPTNHTGLDQDRNLLRRAAKKFGRGVLGKHLVAGAAMGLLSAAPAMGLTLQSLTQVLDQQQNSPETVIVSKTSYDTLGRVESAFDNEGKETRYEYDALGRRTKVIENYENGAPLDSAADVDRVTTYKYNAAGQVIEQAAVLQTTSQVTHYIYAEELSDPLIVSPVARMDLLVATLLPDAIEDGESRAGAIAKIDNETAGGDFVSQVYTATGQVATRSDQRGYELTYTYDLAGRMTRQEVTTGSPAGDTETAYAYTDRGQVETVTTNDGTTDTSAVKYIYDGFGRPLKEFQAHDGTVVETGGSASPAVEFTYDTASTTGYRLAGMVHPNGTKLGYGYGAPGSVDDVLSRPSEILGYTGTSTTIELASYSYTGSGRLASKSLGQGLTSNGEALALDFTGAHPDTSSTEVYGGYDRFGRIARMHWQMKGGVQDTDVFDIRHGYDAAGNKLYADRKVYTGHSQVFDQDELDRLDLVERGLPVPPSSGSYSTIEDLPGISSLRFRREKQDWDLSTLGNPENIATGTNSTFVKNTDFSDSNEYKSRQVDAIQGAQHVGDWFNSSATVSNWESVGSETGSISGGYFSSSVAVADSVDGQTESNARAIFLWGGEFGPIANDTKFKFDNAITTTTRAGVVFGYQDAHNYWISAYKYVPGGQSKREICQVVNGVLTVKTSMNITINPGSVTGVHMGSTRRSMQEAGMGYTFDDGYPSGRVGIYTESALVTFDRSTIWPHDKPSDLAGRWDRYSSSDTQSGSLVLINSDTRRYYPSLLRGARHEADKPWRATFRFRRSGASRNRDGLRFLFNATDWDTYCSVGLYHQSGSAWSVGGTQRVKSKGTSVSGTWTSGNMALASNQNDDLWVRFEYTPGNNKLTMKTVVDNTGEPNDSTWGGTVIAYESTNFTMTGGRVGFRATYGTAYVKEFKLETDNDDNGMFTTEYVEDIGASWAGGYTDIEHESDAAGNLTFDGTYKYTFDAWNHLVKVQNAYRDPDAPTVVQTGSTVAEYKYDGLNRRIERKITNSGDLDATYRDYYRDWQRIETRNGSGQVVKQNIWGLQYIDELIAVVNNPDFAGNSTFDHDFDIDDAKIYMAAHDSLFNVMGLFEFSRMFADMDNNGVVDNADAQIVASYSRQLVEPSGSAPAYVDLNNSGMIDFGDSRLCALEVGSNRSIPVERYEYTPYGERQVYVSAGTADPKAMSPVSRSQRVQESGGDTPVALNDIGFQGLIHSDVTGNIHQRNRDTQPRLGRFMQGDPKGYVDGMSNKALYFVMRDALDPSGLSYQGVYPGGSPPRPWYPNYMGPDGPQADLDAIDFMLLALQSSCMVKCFVLDMTEEDIDQLSKDIINDMPSAARDAFRKWATGRGFELLSEGIIAGLNEIRKDIGAAQGRGFRGNIIRGVLPDAFAKDFREAAGKNLTRAVGLKGRRLLGRAGSKLVPGAGIALTALEICNFLKCKKNCEDDGNFSDDERWNNQLFNPNLPPALEEEDEDSFGPENFTPHT